MFGSHYRKVFKFTRKLSLLREDWFYEMMMTGINPQFIQGVSGSAYCATKTVALQKRIKEKMRASCQ